MAKKNNPLNGEVTAFLEELKHPLREEIDVLRNIILSANTGLTENIKWNGPNYCFDNKDRITMRIQPPTQIQIIFHCGAKVQQQPAEKIIKDNFDLLIWKTNDRAVVTLKNIEAINTNKDDLKKIVNEWIEKTK